MVVIIISVCLVKTQSTSRQLLGTGYLRPLCSPYKEEPQPSPGCGVMDLQELRLVRLHQHSGAIDRHIQDYLCMAFVPNSQTSSWTRRALLQESGLAFGVCSAVTHCLTWDQ